jgi:hypothetical protein
MFVCLVAAFNYDLAQRRKGAKECRTTAGLGTVANPFRTMGGDELFIAQVRVRPADAIDFLALARRERLARVEAEGIRHQALATEHFLNAGDASGEVVGGVEESGVEVGELGGQGEQARREDAGRQGIFAFV